MKGSVETKEKCPNCKGKFKHIKKIGYICPECKTTPRRFFIYLSHQGKRYRIYSTKNGIPLDSYQTALTVLSLINEEIRNHTFDPSKYVKSELQKFFVSNLIDRYFETKKSAIAPSYLPTFKKHLNTAKEFFNIKDVREIRKIDLENYKIFLESQKRSSKTVKNYLDTFKAFLNYCKSTLEIIATIPSFPVIDKPQPKIQWIDPQTQTWILENTPDEDKPILLFLMLTGTRPAEARALKVKNVDLKQGIIYIDSSFSKNTLRPKRKGKNSPLLVIPIHPELKPMLESQIRGKMPEAFVFINPRTRNPYSQDSLIRLWQSIRKKLNLPENLRLYDATRHSLASNLLNQGANLSDISKILGHTNITTTTRYAHIDLQRQKIVLNLISLYPKEREKLKQIKN
ncbi:MULTISPECIES: tyrosine-type recombinase/integrase [Thermodesulfovibrio]|uniref:tyrosine-type recombinase/integrase n=1 Tax=Thermodesulfovibrio TaxID=28261 RepID=UPI00041F7EC2|nr:MULTISPECIES: tyrosine-type recombinase/integrase [Thermodesulfovibrio]